MFGFYGAGLDLFSLMFTIIFIMVVCVFIFTIAKGLSQWNRNNHSPGCQFRHESLPSGRKFIIITMTTT